ncbi:MAG: hypothetical protein KDI36_04250 [Pseudomonadales bacterium]|nr:hypothetical protein [Pseudomonadales bacterium]
MKLLGLPGNNHQTGPWMETIVQSVSAASGQISDRRTQHYAFWQEQAGPIDAEHETRLASDYKADVIIAKSMGSLLTLAAIAAHQLTPARCVFIGVPAGNGHPALSVLQRWDEFGISALFIQQTDDITGTSAQLMQLLGSNTHYELAEIAGHDHVYSDTSELISMISSWLGC